MATRWKSGKHHPAAVYAKQVVSGKLRPMCGKYEILACQRFLNDLERQGTDEFPYVFDETRADRIIRWFGQCIQVRGVFAGEPIELQPWQVFDLSCIYGFVHKDTGARRFNRTYQKRGRGNVKSTENSAKCLYHMCADCMYPPYQPEMAAFEQEPEIDCAAVDKGQARRVYGDAVKIARASANIAKRLLIPKSLYSITPVIHRKRGGYMRPISKDTKNKDSGAPSYFSIDEYHAHPTSEIYDLGLDSFGKRPQSLLDVITTAGDDAEDKPCYAEELYAKQILDGEAIDERYFVMIREIDPEDNPHNKKCWVKSNPVLRYPNEYSRYLLDQIESEYTAAYSSMDATKIRKFMTRRMCRWQAGSEHAYLDERQMTMVRKAMVERGEFAKLTDGLEVYTGFDLGKRIDLSGVGAVFLLPDGRVAIKAHGFLPEEAATRHEHTDKVLYREWSKHGYCTLTPGAVTDNSYVYNWICAGERDNGWKVQEVDYDGHNATDLAIRICQERNNEDFCVEVPQTCAGQNLAVKGFRELLLEGKLVIEYSPLLLWCLGHAVEIENNFGDLKLSKRHKDDSKRIDPAAAVMNALARAMVKRNAKPDLAQALKTRSYHL